MAWRWRFSLSLSVPTLAADELHADDMQAVCNAYPPGRKTAFKCDGLPRHGYSPECADVQQGLPGRCSLGTAESSDGTLVWAPLGALLSLLARRRRRPAP